MIGEAVEGESGDSTDDAIRYEARGFHKRLVGMQGGIGTLVEPSIEASDVTGVRQPTHRGGGDACGLEFGEAQDSFALEKRSRGVTLGGHTGHGRNARMTRKVIRGFLSQCLNVVTFRASPYQFRRSGPPHDQLNVRGLSLTGCSAKGVGAMRHTTAVPLLKVGVNFATTQPVVRTRVLDKAVR